MILKEFSGAKLIIVGDGPYLNTLKREVRALGLNRNVILTGKIDHEKLKQDGIYGAADLFLVTSKTEVGPITVLESNACGVPCVGVDAKNLGYIINHNKSGLVVKPDDPKEFAEACIKILKDRDLYQKFVEGAREELKKHDLRTVLDSWEKVYTHAIKKNEKKLLNRAKKKVKQAAKNGASKLKRKSKR